MASEIPRVQRPCRIMVIFAAVALAAALMGAARAALPPPVAQALAAAGIPESSVGLYVHEVGADRPLIAHGAERALNPASTMKLVTTYAALELLGPAYAWNTEVYAAGPVQNEVLAGDLVIKGYGDPKLTLENFWLLLRGVKARGVRELRGDLILDRTYFAAEEFDPARFDDQPLRPYNTGPDALLVNFKALTVQFVPDAETRTVRLIAEPAMPALQVVNNLTLSDAPCGDWASRLKLEFQGDGDAGRLTIGGTYARDCGERSRSFSLLGHRAYVAALFTQLWKELGGRLRRQRARRRLASGARLVSSSRSPALSEVVRDINKYSNNVMARQLFLTLGAEGAGPPARSTKRATSSGRGSRKKA